MPTRTLKRTEHLDAHFTDILKGSVPIWSEDDAGTPDRERLAQACDRIWKYWDMRRKEVIYDLDLGDGLASFYTYGRIYIITGYFPEGGFINVAKIPKEKDGY